MQMAALIGVALIAALHFYIMILESFLWTTPRGLKAFQMTPEKAEITAPLAKNQGLYNGFLAAGLAWGAYLGAEGSSIQLFFLGCVFVAGIVGAITAKRSILFIQTVPAGIVIALVLLARS
jgi:putative membrane protein